MKPDSLEALLLDRALGALAPEVDELLAEHLATDPEAAARGAALADHVALARLAVAVTTRPNVRPPRWRPKSIVPFATAREWMPLAACLALGALVGWALAPRADVPLAATAAVPAAGEPPAVAPTRPAFWSSARVIAAARNAAPARTDDFRFQPRWFAPAKQPQLVEERQ
jgi:hypothetical protein